MGFGYSYETIEVDSYDDLPTYNHPGKPNAEYIIRNRDGSKHRSRFTDKNGKPKDDIDHSGSGTSGHGVGYPHRHPWNGSRRLDPVPYKE